MIATSLTCLALNIYFEARSETLQAQVAVGQVTLNRVSSPNYPSTVCEVVKQKGQFSWYSDGLSDTPKEALAWTRSLALADQMLAKTIQVKCVGDSLYYHADYVQPYWAKVFKKACKIGTHIFYKELST
jgi:spore germination cell wall hydrolase CwlJ-like protein